MGTVFYYLLWPLVWLYAPLRVRVHALIMVGDEVLVVKNWFGPNRWQLPGGGRKRGESTAQTARREVQEELDIMLNDDGRVLGKYPVPHFQYGLLFHSRFVLFKLPAKPKIKLSDELTDYGWQSVASLPFLPKNTLNDIL